MIASLKESHPEVSERSLCRLFSVSRSWRREKPSAIERKAGKDLDLRDEIERIVLEFPGYGYRRAAELHRRGWAVNRKRVLRFTREESLSCQIRRRFAPTTDSAHGFGVYPNLIKGMETGGLDQVWISDITYIRMPAAFCYLAAILDAHSRRCVGWRLSRRIDASLTLEALEMALDARSPEPGADPSFRQGRSVCRERIRRAVGASRRPHQHGGGRKSLRERQSREFLPELVRR